MGSTAAARRAGTAAASDNINTVSNTDPIRVTGSKAVTPYNWLRKSRATATTDGRRHGNGDRSDQCHFANDQEYNSPARCAQGKPHTNLSRALLGRVAQHAVETNRSEQHSQCRKPDGKKGQRAFIRRAAINLRLHCAKTVNHERGVDLVNGLANRTLHRLWRRRCLHIDDHSSRVLLLEVRHVNRRAQFRSKIRVLDVADNSNYRDLKLGTITRSLSQLTANCVLRRS